MNLWNIRVKADTCQRWQFNFLVVLRARMIVAIIRCGNVMSNSRYNVVIAVTVVAHRLSKWVIRIVHYAEFTASFLHRALRENACQFYDSARLRWIFNPRGTGESLWFLMPGDRGNALLTREVWPKFVLVWTSLTFSFGITCCSLFVQRRKKLFDHLRATGLKCNYGT